MNNIKKFTQKDRYGNMMSFEFDVPPMESIPHPGMPIGTDTVPAWLTPGERVMNAEAERMYGPALEEMNEHGRAIQRAQGGTIPEYAAMGCKVKYKAAGGPVYAQEGMSPKQMSALLANQVLSGALDPRTAEAALANMGMGQGQAQAVTPSFALPQVPPTDYEAEALMGVRSYPEVPTSPQTLNTELPPIRPQQQPTPTDYEGDVYSGRRDYPEVPQVPGTLDAEPPQKYSDRVTQTRELLVSQEGYKTKPYKDTEGNWTVGAGHKITDKDILNRLDKGEDVSFTEDQLMGWFEKDLDTATQGAQKNFSGFNSYSPKLQDALISMNYQLGTEGTAKFTEFRKALSEGDYAKAKAELDDSNWAEQTPARVRYLKSVIDEEASNRVGNKNTIVSTSGQPVVDSRFGIKSTYQGQDVTPEVPPVTEAPQMIDEFGIEQTDVAGGMGDIAQYDDEALRRLRIQAQQPSIVEEAATPVDEFGNISRDLQAEPKTDVVPEVSQGVIKPSSEITAQEKPTVASTANMEDANIPSPKDNAANAVIKETEGQASPEQDNQSTQKVIATGEQAPPEAKSKAQAFFEEFGLTDLFDKKEIGRMVALYLGSRALGYSHGGSLNFAAKNYAERVQQKATTEAASQAKRAEKVVQMVADGKISPKAAEMYKRTGNLAYLDSTLQGGTPQGNFEEFFSPTGKKIRAQKYKMPDGSIVFKTKDGLEIDETYNQDRSRQKGTDEYQARYDKSVQNSKELFEERFELMGGKEEGASEWTKNLRVGPKKASEEFWAFAEENNLIPDSPEARSIMGQAYEQALADAKDGKLKVPSLKPYLEAQLWRETTGTTELWVINPKQVAEDDAMPRYVKQDQKNKLFAEMDAVARKVLPNVSKQNKTVARQRIFEAAQNAWAELPESERQSWIDSTEPKAGVSGFYLYLQDNFRQQLLDTQ